MPNKIVRIHPPGSGPGVRSFATIPTISPNSMQPMSDMTALYWRTAPDYRRLPIQGFSCCHYGTEGSRMRSLPHPLRPLST